MGSHVPIDLAPGLAPVAAVVAASPAPMLLLDADLNVVAASRSFCTAYDLPPVPAGRTPLGAIGVGEWNLPEVEALARAVLAAREPAPSCEVSLLTMGGRAKRVVLSAGAVEDPALPRTFALLLATDVTAAKASQAVTEELLRYKTVLLQELQHRVANTMQMLAGILGENARTARSEETRQDLYEARQRVVSIWALQKRLADSSSGEIALRPYLTEMCSGVASLASSDCGEIGLDLAIEDVRTDAEQALGLVLIATELLINACRHAFPHGGGGRVSVAYRTADGAWTLTVADTGVGMDPATVRAGVGTSIVRALANHLHAAVEVGDGRPGTVVRVHGRASPA